MFKLLKAGCIALYALAIAALFVELPMGSGPIFQRIAIVILLAHALESVVAFKHVKAYQGPFAKSLCLTLLFGLLHWLPIAKASNAAKAKLAQPST